MLEAYHALRKDLARRFQHMDDVKVALEELKEESDSGRPAEAERPAPIPPRRSPLIYAAIAATLALIAASAFWWRLHAPASSGSGLSLRQLTQDAGWTTDPAISPDGKLLAYGSDRAGDGGLDIWCSNSPPARNRSASPGIRRMTLSAPSRPTAAASSSLRLGMAGASI